MSHPERIPDSFADLQCPFRTPLLNAGHPWLKPRALIFCPFRTLGTERDGVEVDVPNDTTLGGEID